MYTKEVTFISNEIFALTLLPSNDLQRTQFIKIKKQKYHYFRCLEQHQLRILFRERI